MLREDIAQRFIDRLCGKLPYNVNIMDPEGIIIACRDAYRKGTYHDIAHRIVLDGRIEVVVREDDPRPPGVLPGVNLPVTYRDQIIGVVGITGPPAEVRNVAFSLKTAIETMVEYEEFKEQFARRQDRKRLLATMLLYDDQARRDEVEALAQHLGYDTGSSRICVVIPRSGNLTEKEQFGVIQRNSLHTKQDMSLSALDGSIVIFRHVAPAGESICFRTLRNGIHGYLNGLDRSCDDTGVKRPSRYWVGSLQSVMSSYRRSYHHAVWISSVSGTESIVPGDTNRVGFFYDRVDEYLLARVPKNELGDAVHELSNRLGREPLREFRATFLALEGADYNIKEGAARLSVHRNTVLHRLTRFQEICGLDPVHNHTDRTILSMVYRHLEYTIVH
jgi:carbohydrate diacid regulator